MPTNQEKLAAAKRAKEYRVRDGAGNALAYVLVSKKNKAVFEQMRKRGIPIEEFIEQCLCRATEIKAPSIVPLQPQHPTHEDVKRAMQQLKERADKIVSNFSDM